ncbi:MAG: Na/Pi symporter [Bacteroidia bacterium]
MEFGVFEILTLLGSLGLFLYGMQTMSDALMAVAGDGMRKILASMTKNRVFAIFTGFLVTTVIQSSSATTLMVVSFVNASLLTLTESIGVIMGANIGTTVTAWIITILGFKVSMSALALPLIALGFVLSFSNKPKRKNWGLFTIGFAVLFIGLQFLKEAVPDIKQNPEILEWLKSYTDMGYLSVILFLAIGTILTVVIQSSSATMALTLVMCYEGWIPFEMAAAMVLGENIGTTITANLASLIGSFNGKRAARAHLIFNTLGVLWMLILFYPFLNMVEMIVTNNGSDSPFQSAVAIPVALSVFHTSFNIINTFTLMWFVPLIQKIVVRMVPETQPKGVQVDKPVYLNESALSYSPTAIQAIINESKRVFEGPVYEIMTHAFNIHRTSLHEPIKPKELIKKSKELIDVDINEMYYSKVKTIYSLILEYIAKITALFTLSKNKANELYQIRLANRHVMTAIKAAKAIQKNIDEHMLSDNKHVKKEYNKLRKRMTKVLRAIYVNQIADGTEQYLENFTRLKNKVLMDEKLLNATLDHLVREQLISSDMAISLTNDHHLIAQITNHLMDAVELLYIKSDTILEGLTETETVEA